MSPNISELLARIKELEEENRNLRNDKKYGLIWEDKPEEFNEKSRDSLPILQEDTSLRIDDSENKPYNIIIEWDNYHSLSALNYTHQGKIDVIYIDPPYNTGNKDFIYNDDYVDKEDSYRHSKWLSFMQKRLELAKNLLKNDWVIFISIDDNEFAQLKLLCDRVFKERNFLNNFIWLNNPAWRQIQWAGWVITKEYILCYIKDIENSEDFLIDIEKAKNLMPNSYKWFDFNIKEDKKWKYIITHELNNWNSIFNEKTRKNLVFNIFYNPQNQDILFWELNDVPPEWFVVISPKKIKNKNVKYYAWRWSKEKILNEKDDLEFVEKDGFWSIFTKRRNFDFTSLKDIFTNILTIHWKQDLEKIWIKNFDYPKPLNLLKILLNVKDQKNSIILDFFAWSGTTGHAVLELNKEDWWSRQFILCSNRENTKENPEKNICRDITYERNKRVIQGYTNAQWENIEGLGGNLRYYTTEFIKHDKSLDTLRYRFIHLCDDLLCIKENTFTKIPLGEDIPKLRVFGRKNRFTVILYDINLFETLKEKLRLFGSNEYISLYLFTMSHPEIFMDELRAIHPNIDLKNIPDDILETYLKIFNA